MITIGYIAQEVAPSALTFKEKKNLLDAVLRIIDNDNNREVLGNATVSLQHLIVHARSNIEFDVKKDLFN